MSEYQFILHLLISFDSEDDWVIKMTLFIPHLPIYEEIKT